MICFVQKLTVLLVLLCPSYSDGFMNNYDQDLDFRCPRNRYLSRVHSVHNNYYEDRIYVLYCTALPMDLSESPVIRFSSGYVNEFDEPFHYDCPTNHFITGMASYHNNYYEDRQHRFYCSSVQGYRLEDCHSTGWVNSYDDPMNWSVPTGYVIKGMTSVHHNYYEDRKFGFDYCRLTRMTANLLNS